MTVRRTSFPDDTNPWTGLAVPVAQQRKNLMANTTPKRSYGPRVDITTLKIGTAQPPATRILPKKYDAFFANMKLGQCVECKPEEANPVANAMRAWIKRNGKPGTVMAAKVCDDGKGRVWWIAKAPKLKAAA